MKNYTIFISILLLLSSFMLFTGFQCASQEMTSARLYVQRSDWENAEKWLLKEVERAPQNAEAWWLLGHTRIQRAKFRDAIGAFDKSLELSNEFAEKIKIEKRYVWSQSLNLGVNFYNKSLDASPDSANILRELAIESYKLAIEISPDSVITYQNLAVAQHAQGYFDDEILTLKEGLKRQQNKNLYTSLINVYLQKAQDADVKGNEQEATENYNFAIDAIKDTRKLDPEDADLLATMIDIYIRIGKANDAKPYIEEALEKDPKNKIYHYNLGVLLMQTDKLEDAVIHFDAALEEDPKYDVALQNAGVAYLRIGDRMKQASQTSDLKKEIDKTYLQKFIKATKYLEKLVELKPEDVNTWDLLASAYANANMIKEAKEALEKADALREK